MSLKFVVFALFIFKASAFECPDHVKTMPDFNPELYVGDWYGTFATYNSYLDETSRCIRASYGELSMFPFLGAKSGAKSGGDLGGSTSGGDLWASHPGVFTEQPP